MASPCIIQLGREEAQTALQSAEAKMDNTAKAIRKGAAEWSTSATYIICIAKWSTSATYIICIFNLAPNYLTFIFLFVL